MRDLKGISKDPNYRVGYGRGYKKWYKEWKLDGADCAREETYKRWFEAGKKEATMFYKPVWLLNKIRFIVNVFQNKC